MKAQFSSKFRNYGIALIMTLMLIVVLVVIVGHLSHTTKIEVYIAQNSNADLQNRYALISAVNYAIAYLQLDAFQEEEQKEKYDALTEVWAQPQKLHIGDSEVIFTITDENSKFNLYNLLLKEYKKDNISPGQNESEKKDEQKQPEEDQGDTSKIKTITPEQHFDRLITLVQGPLKVDPKGLRQSIVAWMKNKRGRDDLPGPFQTSTPIFSVRELLFTSMVTPTMLDGGELYSQKFPGLSHYVTVLSNGKININTADEKIIQSLSEKINADLAKKIVARRDQGDTDGKKAFPNLKAFHDFLISVGAEEGAIFQSIQDIITLESQYFTIEARAKTDRLEKKIVVVVYRNKTKVYKLFCDYQD